MVQVGLQMSAFADAVGRLSLILQVVTHLGAVWVRPLLAIMLCETPCLLLPLKQILLLNGNLKT